jgi:hypothetical protein
MFQRNLWTMLGAGAMLLAACTQPAATKSDSSSSASTQPGVTIASPRVPEATEGGPFPALPDGYRGLGGAFMNQGTLVVVTPDMNGSLQKHDLSVALMHGMAAGHPSDKLVIQPSDCQGRGDAPETAIKVANLADAADEVGAGIACAKLLHPGSAWKMSQLIAKGDGYISQVALRDADGQTVVVYTDINRLANQLIGELGG